MHTLCTMPDSIRQNAIVGFLQTRTAYYDAGFDHVQLDEILVGGDGRKGVGLLCSTGSAVYIEPLEQYTAAEFVHRCLLRRQYCVCFTVYTRIKFPHINFIRARLCVCLVSHFGSCIRAPDESQPLVMCATR